MQNKKAALSTAELTFSSVRSPLLSFAPHNCCLLSGFTCSQFHFSFSSSQYDKVSSLRKNFAVGSEKNDIMFVGQRIKWKTHDKYGPYICVDQKLAVDAVEEVKIDKSLKDNIQCNPQIHTAYQSISSWTAQLATE